MKENIKVKVWPMGEQRSYVQVMNPELLFEESPYGGSVEIIDHRQRYGDGLLQIKENALKMIKDYEKGLVYTKRSTAGAEVGIYAGSFGGIFASMAATLLTVNPLSVLLLLPGVVGGALGGGLIGEKFDERKDKKTSKGLAEHAELFEGMPTSQYIHRIDPELQNIYEAIEGNGRLQYFLASDLEGIQGLLKDNKTREALSPSAINVYQQKLFHSFYKLSMERQKEVFQTRPIIQSLDYHAMWEENPEGFKKYFAELDDARKEQILTEVIRGKVENRGLEEWASGEYPDLSKKVARKMVIKDVV